ncbi:MAG TPA: hypothetical protein VHZ95_13380, partial [Polyangiales bacterium]|nr:hypothetical protein [Polyangiales bacterium]
MERRSLAAISCGEMAEQADTERLCSAAMSGKPKHTRRVVERQTSLSLNDAGVLRLAIVADTHSHPHPKTAERIAAIAPHAILH